MIPDNWVWIDAPCPNCDGEFLFAEGKTETGAPVGEMRCTSCDHTFIPAKDVKEASEPLFMQVDELEVASWSEGKEGEGIPCTQVHVISRLDEAGITLIMRLKSREKCDWLINALIEHRDFVFGKVQP